MFDSVKVIGFAFTMLVGLMLHMTVAHGAKRVALVIGNSAYQQVSKLPNPTNDARDVAAALQRLNFDVTHESDLGRNALIESISNFSEKADNAEIAIFFFAGHGIEISRQNYLIPVDASLKTDKKVRFEAVSLEDVSAAMEGVNGLKVVLLDACRNNPFAKEMKMTSSTRSVGRGLAAPEPNVGSLISFAAKEGTVASDGTEGNSPYTRGLLANIEEPGLEVNFLFRKVRDSVLEATGGKQEPFTYGSLPGNPIYLKPPLETATLAPQAQPQTVPALVIPQPANSQVENSYWNSIVNLDNKQLFESYLERYPVGQFAEIAKYRIAQIDGVSRTLDSKVEAGKQAETGQQVATLEPAVAPEAQRTVELESVEDLVWKVQTELNRVGCSVGRADGKWGNGSKRGLNRFAEYGGYDLPDLYPTDELYRTLIDIDERVCPVRKRVNTATSTRRRVVTRERRSRNGPTVIINPTGLINGILRKF